MAPRHGHRTRGTASGATIRKANNGDAARTMHLQALENLFAQKAGIRPGAVRLETVQPLLERPGDASSQYVPSGYANQQDRQITMAAQTDPSLPRSQMTGGAGPMQTGPLRRALEASQQGTLAHETGHIAEPDVVRNLARARMVQEAHGLDWDPRTGLLGKTPQGRTEMRVEPVQRDPWGLALEGAAPGVHTAPNEMYADDFAAALGYGRRGMTPTGMHTLKMLAQRQLVPPIQHPVNDALQRLTELGIDHTTMPSLSPSVGGGVMRKR